ncbi:MAG: tyrosine-type recombinase/integrase [Thermoguttaceae bacterium]
MAQFVNRKDRYLVVLDSGKSVSLAKNRYKADTAQTVYKTCKHIEASQRNADPLPESVNAWIENAPDRLRQKLQKAGLIAIPEVVTCEELWTKFLEEDRGVVESTVRIYKEAQTRFFRFFDSKTDIATIDRSHIEGFRDALKEWNYAAATVHITLKKCATVFNYAVSRAWIDKSPTHGVRKDSPRNTSKDRIVTLEETSRILASCPSRTWRVIFVLARFCGMRPSEIKKLRWCDVGDDTLFVTSPKTACHAGKGSRQCALFNEVRVELDALQLESGRGGEDLVIDPIKNRVTGAQKTISDIIKKAEVAPIPRPFDNFRFSRSIELRADVTIGRELSAAMLGHSVKVADTCYSAVRLEDLQRAAAKVTMQTGTIAKPSLKPTKTAAMES